MYIGRICDVVAVRCWLLRLVGFIETQCSIFRMQSEHDLKLAVHFCKLLRAWFDMPYVVGPMSAVCG